MKIFGKTLKEYLDPIKHYILGSVLVVISQYYIALPLADRYPFLGNLTQALWALMVALSVYKLVREYDFGLKNLLVLGIFYSFIIHGLKAFFFRIFLFPYMHVPVEELPSYLMGKFLYGSFLVMVIVLISGPVLVYSKKKGLL